MSRRIADLLIKIGADSYEFQQKTKQVERSLDGVGKKLTSIGKSLSLKLTAPIVAMGAASVAAADTQAKAEAKVQQAIKSTSMAAGLSFEQLKTYASELQNETLFGDEEILNNATAQLLTFTNIAGENFKRTQAVALDLSTVLDGDLKSASIQLGKALNDPVKNLSALSRSGIQFSEEQREVINTLAKTNRLAEAQGVILDELERQYGGQAKAAAEVGTGALKQLQNSWGDFMEQIGAAMMPFVNKVAGALKIVVAALQSMSPEMRNVIVGIAGITAAIAPLSLALGGIIRMLPMLATGFTALLSPIGLAVTAVLALGSAFLYAKHRKQEMLDEMTDNFDGLTLGTLERRLKENRRLQEVNERESPWQGNSPYSKLVYALNKGKRRDNLLMEEQALEEAIRRTNARYEERDRAEREAARITEQMTKALSSANTQIKVESGLIGDLKNQIAALEKRKLMPSSTVEDIAECNAEIERLQRELQELQNIKPEDLEIKPKLDSVLGEDFKIEFPAPKIELDDLQPVMADYTSKTKEIFSFVREGLYGWADNTSTYLAKNLSATVDMVENYTTALTNKGWNFTAALDHVSQTVASTMQRFDQQVSQFLADSIVAAADALGKVIAGDLGFGGLMKAILTQFANFLKNIGAQLIEFGIMIIAFKSALKSVLANPWAAIGIGAAMVAAAAIMTALINKNAQESVPALATGGLAYGKTLALVGDNPNAIADPEVIAPLSKLQAMLPSGGGQNIKLTLGGQLVAKGRDLVYVLGKENFKTSILGG